MQRMLSYIRKAVDDKRKDVKNKFLEPYEAFEAEVKDVLAIIDEPIELIDSKLKDFDKKRAAEKLEIVKKIYAETVGDLETYLPFETIFNPKWTNASYKESDIIYDMQEKTVKVRNDLAVISALNSEINDELLELYIKSGNNLAATIQRNSQYMQDKAKVSAQIADAKEKVKEQPTPNSKAMEALNDMVEMSQTVHIIISKADLQEVKNILAFSDIKYQVMEG